MTPPVPRPPRAAEWLLARLLPRDARETVIGDLYESFTSDLRVAASPPRGAGSGG